MAERYWVWLNERGFPEVVVAHDVRLPDGILEERYREVEVMPVEDAVEEITNAYCDGYTAGTDAAHPMPLIMTECRKRARRILGLEGDNDG